MGPAASWLAKAAEVSGHAKMAEKQFWFGVHGIVADGPRILVLRRAPSMAYAPWQWDLPGGHLALGESFEQCLRREVAEETGLQVEVERFIGLHKVPADPFIQAFFACRPTDGCSTIRLRPNEHIESRWVTVETLRSMEGLIPYLRRILALGMLDRPTA